MLIAEKADISRCLIPERHVFLPEVHIINCIIVAIDEKIHKFIICVVHSNQDSFQ